MTVKRGNVLSLHPNFTERKFETKEVNLLSVISWIGYRPIIELVTLALKWNAANIESKYHSPVLRDRDILDLSNKLFWELMDELDF